MTKVRSFTKQNDYILNISREYLSPDDRVLFIDDLLAFGNAGLGIIDLCKQASAEIVGMGFIIEKKFQNGRKVLMDAGVKHIESLAIIESARKKPNQDNERKGKKGERIRGSQPLSVVSGCPLHQSLQTWRPRPRYPCHPFR